MGSQPFRAQLPVEAGSVLGSFQPLSNHTEISHLMDTGITPRCAGPAARDLAVMALSCLPAHENECRRAYRYRPVYQSSSPVF